jgi:nitrogen-specific signal transduction histidine kinase
MYSCLSDRRNEICPENETGVNYAGGSYHSSLNHDVRNSLNAIMGFAQILNYDDLSKDQIKSYTQVICRESENLLLIFTEIFNLISIKPHKPLSPDYNARGVQEASTI